MILHNIIQEEYNKFLNEEIKNKLMLYRGVESPNYNPKDNSYSFFAKNKNFAKDYGDYIWKCIFNPLNLFISYKENYIKELYDNGYKLRDEYIEFNWEQEKDNVSYNFNQKNPDEWGYNSVEDVITSPYFHSDTWEMIEKSNGVVDYILSKYDGIELLEGGELTYYLNTNKIIKCELI